MVVTGVGLVTPLGTGVEKNWEALMAGHSGIGPIERFDVADFPVRIAGEIRDFNPEDWIEKKEIKKMDTLHPVRCGYGGNGDAAIGSDLR